MRPNDLQAHTKRQIAIQKNMKSDTQQRLEDWHKQAEAHAAEQERAAAKLLYDAEELKRKSEAAQQRAALARSRAAELKKQILSPANADVCVIAPPNPTEKGQLFSKYASSIQEPTKEASPPKERPRQQVSQNRLSDAEKQRLFAKYATLLPPPSAAERDAQRKFIERVNSLHAMSPSDFGGFSAPGLWCDMENA